MLAVDAPIDHIRDELIVRMGADVPKDKQTSRVAVAFHRTDADVHDAEEPGRSDLGFARANLPSARVAAGCETPSKSLPSQGWSGGAPAAPHLLNGNGDTRDLRSALASGEERRPPTHFAPWHLPLQPENAQRRRPRRSARATDSDESGDEAPAAVGETGASNSDDMLDPFWNLVSSLTSTLHTCVAPSRRSQPSASAQSDDCGACCNRDCAGTRAAGGNSKADGERGAGRDGLLGEMSACVPRDNRTTVTL